MWSCTPRRLTALLVLAVMSSGITPAHAAETPVQTAHGYGRQADRQPPATVADWEVIELGDRNEVVDHVIAPPEVDIPRVEVETRNIDLFVGQIDVLQVSDISRVAIGQGSVLRAQVLDDKELLLIGKSAGSSSLRLWRKDGSHSDLNVRVSESDPETRVHMEDMVRMSVRMVEFRKSALKKLGIDWNNSMKGPTFAVAGDVVGNNLFRPESSGIAATLPNRVKPFSSYLGIASSITSTINMLAASGDATTLAEPVLSCANGGTATFLAGGEVPYPTIAENGQTIVDFKEYGIRLSASPVVDPSGNISVSVDTEISQIDASVTVNDAPGLLTRRSSTQVNVQDGQTIVISGLLRVDQGEDEEKMPILGDLPVLGQLFRNRNTQGQVTELVVFLTPEVIDPVQPLGRERERSIFEQSRAMMEEAREQIEILD